jgi:peptidyl-prolyl cis-trans isomerase A (cyclophilin A)
MTKQVVFQTPYGRLLGEVFVDRAPVTANNFLRHVDEGLYKNATFYRAARPDNDERSPTIRIIQGGIDPTCRRAPLPPIRHESTQITGLRHLDGSLSAVRWDPDNGISEFFIAIGDNPCLDFAGSRLPDGQGAAVFGRVVEGMDIVRRINASPTGTTSSIGFMKGQALMPPIPLRIERIFGVTHEEGT